MANWPSPARFVTIGALALMPALAALPAHAQLKGVGAGLNSEPLQKNGPVSFTADHVDYDRTNAIVTASGHVEAWQNDHVLHADTIVFDRNTGVVTASGHVALLEPDGEVLFADKIELTGGMRNAALEGMRAILAQNGRLAANSARRTDEGANELSQMVYSACNLCASDPSKPPMWQIEALSAVQNLQTQRLEFEDPVLEMFGLPILAAPYFSTSDPSVKRQSGFLEPAAGYNTFIGDYFSLPYYYVLDNQSDVTITPTIDSRLAPQLDALYRQRFNNGVLTVNAAVAYDENAMQGLLFTQGQFNINDQWRWGFNVNEASSSNYLRDFQTPGYGQDFLSSNIYGEAFGQGSYTRIDTYFYQGLLNVVNNNQLPYVAPRYLYSYVGEPDSLGGVTSFNGGFFNIYRVDGTKDERLNGTLNYQVSQTGQWGDLWTFTAQAVALGYNAYNLNQIPNYTSYNAATTQQITPTAAVHVSLPLVSTSSGGSSTLIEPIVQLVASPTYGASTYANMPNEDSLDILFTDANLFSLNHFAGIDRQSGGLVADVGMHGAYYGADGSTLDALIGQSYRNQTQYGLFPAGQGLGGYVSDIVGHFYYAPNNWFDVSYRYRLDHATGQTRFADLTTGFGPDIFKLNVGYFYDNFDPFYYLNQAPGQHAPPGLFEESFYLPRNESIVGFTSKYKGWTLGAYAQQNLTAGQLVIFGGNFGYQNECFAVTANYFDLVTSYNGISNVQALTIQITFKTLGQFGFPLL
jgi:LPS-assembly protein